VKSKIEVADDGALSRQKMQETEAVGAQSPPCFGFVDRI